MLKFLRKQSVRKYIFIALAIVIIPPFLMWGIISNQKEAKTPSLLGTIDGHQVSVRDYLASYKAVQHQVMLMYGEQAKEMASYINYKGEAWDRLLLVRYAKKENIKVSDKEVVNWLMEQQMFVKNGEFDQRFYKLYVNNYLKMEPRQFEEEIRQILSIQKIEDRLKSKIKLTPEELKKAYAEKNGDLDIAYAIIPWESEKDKVVVSEDDLKNLYPMIKNQLKDPKTGKETSFDEIKTELSTMLVKEKAVEAAQKKMEELKAKIDPSNPFEKVMTEAGLEIKTAEKISALKEIPGIGSIRNVRKATENLKEGETSRAFTTANGAIILKVVKTWPIDEKKFEQEKETFEKEALREKTTGAMTSLIEDLRKKLNVNLETMKKLFSDGPQ